MRVLIADDEPLARARLQALLRDCAGAELVGSVGSARAALEALPVLKPTVLLLDIEMPGVDGLALAERIARLTPPPQVIFCTAYAQHALRAYELKAADYLLKPVRIERLREALERARRLHAESAAARPHLSGMVRGMRQRVPLDEIIALLADDKYVTVHHSGGTLLIEDSLRTLEQTHPERWLRLHRSCLVPRERLLGLNTLPDGRIVAQLAGSTLQPEISRRNLASVRAWLRNP
ncbi:LytTR family DNA-binding domain-containing protein [Metallibacterium sp.]|jgi:two-component system response regulator AlgR|nr:LytTR family DNA-binding domain-containing protein [Metallibacterium sp.]